MRLIPRIRTRLIASELGFSMIAVMGVMAASSLFVAAAFAAANGDLPLTRDSQDRKQAYAAAEAGINYYQFHLNQDSDYWTRCTNVPPPNGTENQPVNQRWNGITPPTDPRRWRKVAGTPTEYTIELLPANGAAQCVEGDQTTMIDPATGSFKIRATGRPRPNSKLRRTLVSQFRRRSFLDFLYFTEYETTDPIAYSSSWQSWAQSKCGDKPRALRATTGGPNSNGCAEIQFADFDDIKGPFHTNDDILTCGTATFGRPAPHTDSIEFSGPPPGYTKLGGSCSGNPVFGTTPRADVEPLKMPPTNGTLKAVAQAGGRVFNGETWIRFNGDGTMQVRNKALGGACYTFGNQGGGCNLPLPGNGVIYVETPLTGANCSTVQPSNADYAITDKCGNLYVSGDYTKSLTLSADNDIIVRPWMNTSKVGDINGIGTSVMGLIAQNFVRVYHPCSPENGTSSLMKAVTIDAALLSLEHSFTVDNHDCGSQLDQLTVMGAIAQKYRGVVGTTGGTGFKKNYLYDDRLRYRSPPYFLNPIAASWHVVRSNEQVPPR